MAWTKLDDKWDDSEKLERAAETVGDSSFALWARAVTFCNRNLTNGRISGAKLRSLTKHRRPKDVVAALVSVRALDDVGDDTFEVHDFLDWNDTREEVEMRRAVKREAASKGGRAAAEARQRNASDVAPCLPSGTPLECPPPLLSSPLGSSNQDPPAAPERSAARSDVETVWAAYVDAYLEHTGRRGLVLNDSRRRLIRSRLKDHTAEQLCDAARGVFRDSWCVERRKWEPEWVWQNAGNVERFAALGADAANDTASGDAMDELLRRRRERETPASASNVQCDLLPLASGDDR